MANKRIFNYPVAVGLFLLYLLFLIKNNIQGSSGITFILFLIPLVLTALFTIKQAKNGFRDLISSCAMVFVFYFFYFILSNLNIGKVNTGFINFAIFASVIVIIYALLNNSNLLNTKNYIITFLLITIFLIFLPHYAITQSLEIGSFYNLMSKDLLFTTTIEAPLIVAFLFLLSCYDIFFNKNWTILNVISVLVSCYVLLLFSRRGFIFSSVISLSLYYLYIKTNSKLLLYSTLLILVLPMFWTFITQNLADLFQSDMLKSLSQNRSNSDQIITATGRATSWILILDVFYAFDLDNFFGMRGGPPEHLFIQVKGEAGRYSHAHNSFLQLFLEGGYFLNFIFIAMLILSLRNFIKAHKINKDIQNFYLIMLFFLFSLSVSESLIRLLSFSSFAFCFILIAFNMVSIKTINAQYITISYDKK